MAALVTLWQVRKLASYSAFFPVCLVEERNDFYLQELHSSNSRFVIHRYGCTDSEPGYSNTRVRREKRWSTAGICRPRTGSGTQNPSGNASLPSSLHCSMTRLPPSRQYTRAEESDAKQRARLTLLGYCQVTLLYAVGFHVRVRRVISRPSTSPGGSP